MESSIEVLIKEEPFDEEAYILDQHKTEDSLNTAIGEDNDEINLENCSQSQFLEKGDDLLLFKKKLHQESRQSFSASDLETEEPLSPDVSEYILPNAYSESHSSNTICNIHTPHSLSAEDDLKFNDVQNSFGESFESEIIGYTKFGQELPAADYNNSPVESDIQDASISGTSTPTDSASSLSTTSAKKNYQKKANVGTKRKRDPSVWKMNVLKRLKNSGQEYKKKGKLIKKKELGPGCDETKCRRRCKLNVSYDDRLNLFTNFWLIANHDKQREYLSRFVTRSERTFVRLNKKSRRNWTFEYCLQIAATQVQVCKKTFIDTFNITDMWLTTMFKKIDSNEGGTILEDLRGRHKNRGNAIDENIKISIRDHINSIPIKETHSVRQRTCKLYFDESLSFAKLYVLYTEWMMETHPGHSVASKDQYRQLFNNEFNIGFFIPKKDQCLTCEIRKTANQEEISNMEREYTLHIANKYVVREIKNNDKAASQKSNGGIVTACYDFQKILATPQSEVSLFCYKRKFRVYNFTVFNIGSGEGYCYAWDETAGRKGPNEISSALFDFIKRSVANGAREFRFYSQSDCCGGQDRNRIILSMYVYAAKLMNVSIVHNFFEVGHSQSEGDSMHAFIERRKKNQVIYIPQQWYTLLIRCAKTTGKPYDLKELGQHEILDFKSLIKKIPNWDLDQDKQKVSWSKIKHLRVCSDKPYFVHFQYDFISDHCSCIDLENKPRMSKRTNKSNKVTNISIWDIAIPVAYRGLHPISTLKYKDLLSLCTSGAIPEQYRSFYLNIPHSQNVSQLSDDED